MVITKQKPKIDSWGIKEGNKSIPLHNHINSVREKKGKRELQHSQKTIDKMALVNTDIILNLNGLKSLIKIISQKAMPKIIESLLYYHMF